MERGPERTFRWLLRSGRGRTLTIAVVALAVAASIGIIRLGAGPSSVRRPHRTTSIPSVVSSPSSSSPAPTETPATSTPSFKLRLRPRWNGFAPWRPYAGRDGRIGNDATHEPSVSATGRWIAFKSSSSNLVRGDTNGGTDVFVKDRATGRTTRVSVSSGGRQANGGSVLPVMSADGRFIAFRSDASNLVPGDTNLHIDIFVHDQMTHQTFRASVSSAESQANRGSGTYGVAISSDGRYVAFSSEATNLVPGDTNRKWDIFLRDRVAGTTSRVSLSPEGKQANGDSAWLTISHDGSRIVFTSTASNLDPRGGTVCQGHTASVPCSDVFMRDLREHTTTSIVRGSPGANVPAISGNGRFVAFASTAENLVPGDTNGESDVFVFDIANSRTTRVSISSSGEEGNGGSGGVYVAPAISKDGRYVAFETDASNLVPHDDQICGGFYEDEPYYSCTDVVLRDRTAATTTLMSVTTTGQQANFHSSDPAISADGRHVVFTSMADNIGSMKPASCAAESRGCANVYVRDRLEGTTRLVSTASPRR